MRRSWFLACVVIAVVAGLAMRPAADVSDAADTVLCPVISDLAMLPAWSGKTAVAINNGGEIVGRTAYVDGKQRSFIWTNGRATDLGTLGGKGTFAFAINDQSVIVGSSETATGKNHAFLWQSGKMTDLRMLPGGASSAATAINGHGQIVGWSTVASGATHVVLWDDGKMRDLGTLGRTTTGGDSYVTINDRGEIVGSQGILWRAGKTSTLGNLGGGPLDNYAAAINGQSQIVGYSSTKKYNIHAVLWQDGKTRDLALLPGGGESRAAAINDAGQIVGWSITGHDPTISTHGFLWQDGKMLDLGALPTYLYSEAVAINDSGQIIGSSSSSVFGTRHAVLWTLQPTSATRCPAPTPWESGASVVLNDSSIIAVSPIDELRADAGRALIRVPYTGPDKSLGNCVDIFVWDRANRKIVTVFDHRTCNGAVPMQSFGDVALAGANAAWLETSGGNFLESYVYVRSLATGSTSRAAAESAAGEGAWGRIAADPAGENGVLVYRDYTRCAPASVGSTVDVPCPKGVADFTTVLDEVHLAMPAHRMIATSGHPLTVLAVGGGRVAVRVHAGSVIVLAPTRVSTGLRRYTGFSAEHLIASYTYKPGAVVGAATDGRTLAVLRKGALDVIPLAGGHSTLGRRTLQVTATKLSDIDGHTAVYIRATAVHVLDLATGRSMVIVRPTARPVSAQLEPDGLYIAAGRTLTFTPRSQVEQRLHR